MSEQFLLPCALLKSARYQLVMLGIVDGFAENFRNVIIMVSFRLFFKILPGFTTSLKF